MRSYAIHFTEVLHFFIIWALGRIMSEQYDAIEPIREEAPEVSAVASQV